MSTPLTFDTARAPDGRGVRLIAAGEIDLSTVDELKAALSAAIGETAGGGAELIVDFAAVEYVDSAAINVLSADAEAIHKVLVHPFLLTTFRISGLSELVTVEAAQT